MREFGTKLPGIVYVERPGAYAFIESDDGGLAVIRTGFGVFLPGGGLEAGENSVTGLAREVHEEIGYTIKSAEALGQAAQYHWSEFYSSYFKKIGTFFRVVAEAPSSPRFQADHKLLWLSRDEAARSLTQEFQRWAVGNLITG